jgi:hypothetical protein
MLYFPHSGCRRPARATALSAIGLLAAILGARGGANVSTVPDPFATTVSTNFSGPILIGIAYSVANSLFIDFSSGAEGWT